MILMQKFRQQFYKEEVQGLKEFAFPVVTVMMKKINQGSKESLGVKFKEGICAKCQSSCLKAAGIFVIFKNRMVVKVARQKKVLNNHFLKSLQKHPYADVLQNRYSQKFPNIHKKTSVLESLFNKFPGLTACNFI